jgi:divalent metal cation (Fe/Co/Zn/Cd) transporter
VRLAAARHGLGAHAIQLCKGPPGRELDLHLEVEGEVSLLEADRRVRRFEEEVRGVLGLGAVHVHLEPVDSSALERGVEEVSLSEFEEVKQILIAVPGAPLPEELRVVRVEGALRIYFRFAFAPELTAAAAREKAKAAEKQLREGLRKVGRVLVRLGVKET